MLVQDGSQVADNRSELDRTANPETGPSHRGSGHFAVPRQAHHNAPNQQNRHSQENRIQKSIIGRKRSEPCVWIMVSTDLLYG